MARVTTVSLKERKSAGEKISVLTAYDYPTARLMDESGVDVLLVGDSLGMALHGHHDTLRVTMDMMVYHTPHGGPRRRSRAGGGRYALPVLSSLARRRGAQCGPRHRRGGRPAPSNWKGPRINSTAPFAPS